jgi:hypothetical protein
VQAAIAAVFGGWGLWLREATLSREIFGSTLRTSTAVFHIWPWPFRFAAILDMPAFLAGGLLSWPLELIAPGLPEWVSALPMLPLVALLWYWIGAWADRTLAFGNTGHAHRLWFVLVIFILLCAVAALTSESFGSYTSWFVVGFGIWLFLGIGIGAIRIVKAHQADHR